MRREIDGEIVAIDGKEMRRSYDSEESRAAIHMRRRGYPAWASTDGLCLGQGEVDQKSNALTAIAALLQNLLGGGIMPH